MYNDQSNVLVIQGLECQSYDLCDKLAGGRGFKSHREQIRVSTHILFSNICFLNIDRNDWTLSSKLIFIGRNAVKIGDGPEGD